MSSTSAWWWVAALLTRMSRRPSSTSIRSISSFQAAESVTSSATARPLPAGRSPTVRSAASRAMSAAHDHPAIRPELAADRAADGAAAAGHERHPCLTRHPALLDDHGLDAEMSGNPGDVVGQVAGGGRAVMVHPAARPARPGRLDGAIPESERAVDRAGLGKRPLRELAPRNHVAKAPRARGWGVKPTSVAGPARARRRRRSRSARRGRRTSRWGRSRGRAPGASQAVSCSPELAITTSSEP